MLSLSDEETSEETNGIGVTGYSAREGDRSGRRRRNCTGRTYDNMQNMEYSIMGCLGTTTTTTTTTTSSDHERELKAVESSRRTDRGADSPSEECARSDTPSSDASTSGVCSMASSDFDACGDEKQLDQERETVVKYLNRDVLDLYGNLHPYGLFQTTSVPKMNMSNYWERRSVYHRLGPYGRLDEFDYEKCCACDFYATIPKKQ